MRVVLIPQTDSISTTYTPTGYRVLKLLSEDPANYPDAPREVGMRVYVCVHGRACQLRADGPTRMNTYTCTYTGHPTDPRAGDGHLAPA